MYVIDRTNGQVLSANPYVYITTTTGVYLKTGELKHVADKAPKTGQEIRNVCPPAPGAKDWQPSSFSPKTGLVYVPHQNLGMDIQTGEANYIAGTPYVGATDRYYAGPGGYQGELMAWDPIAGKKVWTVTDKYPIWSRTVTTAGDLVFFGTLDGWFKAADDQRAVHQVALRPGAKRCPRHHAADDPRPAGVPHPCLRVVPHHSRNTGGLSRRP